MKRFVFVCLLLSIFGAIDAQAANWYVRSAAGGNGTSWASAWSNVTNIVWTSIQPGDTIWIAGGNYGGLNVGKSGNADTPAGRIFVKRATVAAHGSDTGWNAAFDAQVALAGIRWASRNIGSFVTIDGQVDRGILVVHGNSDSAASVSFDAGASFVTLRYLDLKGPGDTTGFHHLGDDRSIDMTAWNGSSYDPVDNIRVEHSKIHGACTQIWNMNSNNGIWEYNEIYNSTDSNGNPCHPNIFVTASSTNLTIRYNLIHDYDAEGIMIINGGHGTLFVYGNVWYNGQTYARVMEVQNGTNGPALFYNNTLVGLWGGIMTSNGGVWASGSAGRNNIWWSMSASDFSGAQFDFCSGACSGTGSISNGSNPFVNLSADDYRITSTVGATFPRDKGTNLGAPYNIDLSGTTRGGNGAWDIGAYEYASASGGDVVAPTPPQNVRIQ